MSHHLLSFVCSKFVHWISFTTEQCPPTLISFSFAAPLLLESFFLHFTFLASFNSAKFGFLNSTIAYMDNVFVLPPSSLPCFHLPCTFFLCLRSIRNSVFICAGLLPCFYVGKNCSSSKAAVHESQLFWFPFASRTLSHRILSSSSLSKDKPTFQKPRTVILLFVLFACLSFMHSKQLLDYLHPAALSFWHLPEALSGLGPLMCYWSEQSWRTCRVLSALLMNCSPFQPGNAVSLPQPWIATLP